MGKIKDCLQMNRNLSVAAALWSTLYSVREGKCAKQQTVSCGFSSIQRVQNISKSAVIQM